MSNSLRKIRRGVLISKGAKPYKHCGLPMLYKEPPYDVYICQRCGKEIKPKEPTGLYQN